MKKAILHANEQDPVQEAQTIKDIENISSSSQPIEKPEPEGLDIDFEPIPMPEEEPVKPTIEMRLEKLEEKQDQVIQMLQLLCSRI